MNTLFFNKILFDKIVQLRAEGNDPYPGIEIIETKPLPQTVNPKIHPFAKYKGES